MIWFFATKRIKSLNDQANTNIQVLTALAHELSGCVDKLKNKQTKKGEKHVKRTDETRVQNNGILAYHRG